MARFTTRVELHGARPEDYDTLHARMEAQGFTRTIATDQGVAYKLPTAEYNLEGNATTDQVLDKAKAAAGQVRSTFSILVTASIRTWFGLDKA